MNNHDEGRPRWVRTEPVDSRRTETPVAPRFGTARTAQLDVYRLQVWPARRGRRFGYRVQLYDDIARPLLRERRPFGRQGLWRLSYEGVLHAGISAAYDVHAVMTDVNARLVVWLDGATVVDDRH